MNRILLIALAALAGCSVTRQSDLAPLNKQATKAGIPQIEVKLYGTGYGPAKVTMPDGEVLNGHYHLAIGGTVASGFGSAIGTGGSAIASGASTVTPMQNPFMLQASSVRGTSIMCEGEAGGYGHGRAICTTNGDARYQMIF